MPSHSSTLPFGRSMRRATPAKVVISAIRVAARWNFASVAIRLRRSMEVLFIHPVELYKKARRRLSRSRGGPVCQEFDVKCA